MARRQWREQDHPRHPGGTPAKGGQFREKVGGSGWAARLNSMLGGRRGASERQVRRAGGRSDLAEVTGGRDDEQAFDDVVMVTDGSPDTRQMAIRLEGLGDPERARRAYRGLRPGQQEGIRAHLGIESAGLRRGEPYMPQREVDLANEQAILDRLYPEASRQRLRDLADRERMDEGGNLPRLTNQEVADALAPQSGPPLRYGAQTIVLDDRFSSGGQKTRFGAFLNLDMDGDYILDSGAYGVNPPAGGWSVETGYSPKGKDMAYWGRVRDNLAAIDQWMAQNHPGRGMRLKIDFEGDQMHIRNYDYPDGPPLVTLSAR